MERAVRTKIYRAKHLKRKHKIRICYFHRFSVEDHLQEHYCTFEQLVGKTLIEIESEVAKETKNLRSCFLQNIVPVVIL